jgi:osmoprotectant transport system ATP-binding protein
LPKGFAAPLTPTFAVSFFLERCSILPLAKLIVNSPEPPKPFNHLSSPSSGSVAVAFDQVGYLVRHPSTHETRTLVSDLNFTIAAGEFLVLLGRSGSGKTTTMKLINRLLAPTSGTVQVQGQTTTAWDPIELRRQIGYVIQETGLFPHFTIERNIGLVPTLQGWKPKQIKSRAHELLHLVGLDPAQFATRYPHQLSGGQRQRVGVARALAANPPILLMDEPFGAWDPITRLELQQELGRLQRELGKTVVFVTHDIQEAFALASRIGLMQDGRLVILATPEEFARSPEPEVQTFLQCLRPVIPAG